MIKKMMIILSSCLLMLLTSNMTQATMAKKGEHPRKPPQEAIDACENKNEGDAVSFITKRGDEKEATCQTLPDDESLLVAVPNVRERPRREQ